MIASVQQIAAGGRVSPRFAESAWVTYFDQIGLTYEITGGPAALAALGRHLWCPRSRQALVVEPAWNPEYFRAVRALDHIMPPPPYVEEPGALDVWLILLGYSGGFYGHGRFGEPGGPLVGGLVSDLELVRCDTCATWFWLSSAESWGCRCCGRSDGRRHLERILRSPIPGWPLVEAETARG